jgi:hypothetical protein
MGSEIGFRRPQRGAQRAPIGRLLPPKQHAREAYGYLPNSFSTHSGELGREEGSKRVVLLTSTQRCSAVALVSRARVGLVVAIVNPAGGRD